ncbi:hypothetical protein C0993_000338, partial [Termitomyces sp. T159_Od127]
TWSGAIFSPYNCIPIHCSKNINFPALLRNSVATEGTCLEDVEFYNPGTKLLASLHSSTPVLEKEPPYKCTCVEPANDPNFCKR